MAINKYNKNTINIEGREIDRADVVFVPKPIVDTETKKVYLKTSDGVQYERLPDGSLRKVKRHV